MGAMVEVPTMFFGSLSLLLLILCAGSDCWRQDAKDPLSSVGLSARCRGLWSECIFDNVADLWTCDIPVSYLSEHPIPIVVTRVLVILAGILSLSAMPAFLAGMRCTKLFSDTDAQKHNFSLAAGSMFLVGGLLGTIAVIWYGIDTVQKYKLEVSFGIPGVTYELGYSFWMAAAGASCAVASGVMLLTAECFPAQRPRKGPLSTKPSPIVSWPGTYL